jgi:hypothetical protein
VGDYLVLTQLGWEYGQTTKPTLKSKAAANKPKADAMKAKKHSKFGDKQKAAAVAKETDKNKAAARANEVHKKKAAAVAKEANKKKANALAKEDIEAETEISISNEDQELQMDVDTINPTTLIKDDEDQKYLDYLPELKRKAVLGERYEKRHSGA